MVATIATAQAMFKQQLEPKVIDQIEQDVILEDLISETGENAEGVTVDMKNNLFEIVSKVNGMTAYAGGEGATLIYSDAGTEKMSVGPKFVTAAFKIGHEALMTTLKDQAALERLVDMYGLEIRKSLMRAKAMFLRGNGSGIIGILPAGVVTGTAITISGKAAGTVVSGAKFALGSQYFQAGQEIQFGTETDFAGATQVDAIIASVDSDTQITLTASKTVGAAVGANNRGGTNAATWYIRLKGTYGNTPMGLLGLVDDGTLSGITTIQTKVRSATPYMKSFTLSKANKTTIIKDFRTLYVGVRKNNRKPKYFMCSQDVYDSYTDAITITMQSNPGNAQYQTKLGTGHTGLMFAYGDTPIPIFLDEFLPAGTVLLLDPQFLFCADLFQDDYIEGGILARISGTKYYESIRAAYFNFGTYSSRKLGGQLHYDA
jgi:hypothetical protein